MNNINMMNIPHSFDTDTILQRMTNALVLRLDQRCADLAVLFDRATKQDLQSIFPILIDHIFGPQGSFTWNLKRIHAENHIEFTNIVNFLKPQGPLFKLIYSLLQDVTIKYEFSLNFLPTKVRQMLDGPNINPFYNEIIQYANVPSGAHRQIMCLLLNPFDYYIFHFVYHLINPCHQQSSADEHWNTVYYNLCAEYLLHFFPTVLDTPVYPLINFYLGKNPVQSTQYVLKPYKHSTLLKQNLFGDPQVTDMKVMHQHIEKHPRNEIWRSETLLMAIIDFWLSNDQVCMVHDTMTLSPSYPMQPSDDYIRIVRVTVKHLHAFASTAIIDNSSLGELKKHTLPMMQARMYVFLRNLLHRWPLDESFRLVLELWLSFIQPWRYASELYNRRGGIYKTTSLQQQNVVDEATKNADENYTHFIAENLLVYVVILQQLLPRFMRIDLASPKNAQMLYRLTKVFNQQNLIPLLKKVESLVENKNYSPTHHSSLNYSSIMPPLSPTSRWSTNTNNIYSSSRILHEMDVTDSNATLTSPREFSGTTYEAFASKYLNLVRQKIYELEGPSFVYKPMFVAKPAVEIYELLKLVKSSEIRALRLLETCKMKQTNQTSWWALLFGNAIDVDEISLHDRQRAPVFLKNSAEFLIEMFQVTDFFNFDVTPEQLHERSANETHIEQNSYPTVLTPTKVKERLMNLRYDGDPDLIPIRGYEVAFLVRMFHVLSTNINEQYGAILSRLYYTNSFPGRFMSNFVQEPMQAFRYEKSLGTSRRVMYHLPPRISLRKFSNKNFLLFVILGTFLVVWFDHNWLLFPFIYFCICLFVALWRTFLCRRSIPTIDLNFNDSLDD